MREKLLLVFILCCVRCVVGACHRWNQFKFARESLLHTEVAFRTRALARKTRSKRKDKQRPRHFFPTFILLELFNSLYNSCEMEGACEHSINNKRGQVQGYHWFVLMRDNPMPFLFAMFIRFWFDIYTIIDLPFRFFCVYSFFCVIFIIFYLQRQCSLLWEKM